MNISGFSFRSTSARQPFSSLELLMAGVMVGIMMVIVVPAVQSLKEVNDFANLGNGAAGAQEPARPDETGNHPQAPGGFADDRVAVVAGGVATNIFSPPSSYRPPFEAAPHIPESTVPDLAP
jgi:hypothetical protein